MSTIDSGYIQATRNANANANKVYKSIIIPAFDDIYQDVIDIVAAVNPIEGENNLSRLRSTKVMRQGKTVTQASVLNDRITKTYTEGKEENIYPAIIGVALAAYSIIYTNWRYVTEFFTGKAPRQYSRTVIEQALRNTQYKIPTTLRRNTRIETRRLIRRINKGLSRGDSLDRIARNTRRFFKGSNVRGSLYRPGGAHYNAMRVIRTETSRMRGLAQNQFMLDANKLNIGAKLRYIATLDDRTRAQSGSMDGQISREDGKFRYPNGFYYTRGNTGYAKWDVNERCTSSMALEDYPPETRTGRRPTTGINRESQQIVEAGTLEEFSYRDYPTWAREQGLVRNRYGEMMPWSA